MPLNHDRLSEAAQLNTFIHNENSRFSFLCVCSPAGNLYEDGAKSFNQSTAAERLTNDKRTGSWSAERGTHKALQGPSGRGYKEAEMNLTNHRPSPGDISSTHHWSPGWLTAGPSPHASASEPSLAHSTGRRRRGAFYCPTLSELFVVSFFNYRPACGAGGREHKQELKGEELEVWEVGSIWRGGLYKQGQVDGNIRILMEKER